MIQDVPAELVKIVFVDVQKVKKHSLTNFEYFNFKSDNLAPFKTHST